MTNNTQVSKDKALYVDEKMLAGLVFDMSQLEDNPHTFPEVQTLLEGISVGGRKVSDQEQVIRIADGWKTIIADVRDDSFEISKSYAIKINSIVARNEALEVGGFRTGLVGIAGTDYRPPVPDRLPVLFEENRSVDIKQLPESAYRYFLSAARNQYFWDGNKRTGQLMMNGTLMTNGYLPVSIAAKHRLEYNKLMVPFYESGDTSEMEAFLSASIPWPTENLKSGDTNEKND